MIGTYLLVMYRTIKKNRPEKKHDLGLPFVKKLLFLFSVGSDQGITIEKEEYSKVLHSLNQVLSSVYLSRTQY